ncbi:type I restriction-modification system subunit M [Helicobacter felis]|uniref:type I restriction-modification system subunit M n=1 Tax=Helicobacter felis TaxID=214 RepID=UPI000CF0F59D|nr:class I SAM-dependent DNA methyltransferase [Helicobacter felis]
MDGAAFQPIVNFIWSIADLLRNHYKRGKYRDVILPMTIIRRLDAILEPTKEQVLQKWQECTAQGLQAEHASPLLCAVSGSSFYNTSPFTLNTLTNYPSELKSNFSNYLAGFSPNVCDILEKFDFEKQLDTLENAGILFNVVQEFCSSKVNFSIKDTSTQKGLSNLGMGYVFEELIRKFNEENNEEAGEHFTPREIIALMAELVFRPVCAQIQQGTFLIYDNACGSGGMLTESKAFAKGVLQSSATFHLYGQEVNPETYALCKADMLIKGEDPDKIKFGSTLSQDGFSDLKFDFMLTNPPFGKKWGSEQKNCRSDLRFNVGVTGADDGQMMFLLNMLSKMKDTPLGSRLASVHNGSALFNSDSGQVAIRSHIIQNDFLEAVIALPLKLFYNTGIPTFIWILNNRKPAHKQGKVQLIDATSYFEPMQKSLGQKCNYLTPAHIDAVVKLFLEQPKSPHSVILENADLGYQKFSVFALKASQELLEEEAFNTLSNQEVILKRLKELESNPPKLKSTFKNTKEFLEALHLPAPKLKTKEGIEIPAPLNLFDKQEEKIPLKEDKEGYFLKEIQPFTPLSFIEAKSLKIGYEILFNQYFYIPSAQKSLAQLQQEITDTEAQVQSLLSEIWA